MRERNPSMSELFAASDGGAGTADGILSPKAKLIVKEAVQRTLCGAPGKMFHFCSNSDATFRQACVRQRTNTNCVVIKPQHAMRKF